MENSTQLCVVALVTTLLALSQFPTSQAQNKEKTSEKAAVFLSPKFEMGPGSVVDKFYYNIDFPIGHIGLKSFNAEVVDENGKPVPLHETYLHHWVVNRYYQRRGLEVPKHNGNIGFYTSDRLRVRNSGLCDHSLGQYFGLGSETRRTKTHLPHPYAIELGNPLETPQDYDEVWMLNVHAIDTRGVENKLGCTECKCDLYNVTVQENGQPLRPNYKGGLKCCYDETQCRLRKGFEGVDKRGLYMRYTVKWVDWDDSLVPVRIYILDVTDLTGRGPNHHCLVEYNIESCASESNNSCIDSKRVSIKMPIGGSVVYGVAHQHTGGLGSALYGQDGRVICSSMPTYGQGNEHGDEHGYIVGMSTCYPNQGSVKIYDGETLFLESNYSKDRLHTGVMGLFYILVADEKSTNSNSHPGDLLKKHEILALPKSAWVMTLFGVAIAIAIVVHRRRSAIEDGYQPIAV